MKVHEPCHRNPFDNVLVHLCTHVIALSVACGSVHFAMAEGSWAPLAIGVVVVTLMEAAWGYCHLRR